MATWPKSESNLPPEGHYTFHLCEEPVFESYTYNDKKTGQPRQGNKITFFAVGTNEAGEFRVRESMFVWDQRYADLCEALNVVHGRDIKMAGAEFEGDIKHGADRNDPLRFWPRILKIKRSANAPTLADDDVPAGPADDDPIPF